MPHTAVIYEDIRICLFFTLVGIGNIGPPNFIVEMTKITPFKIDYTHE